MLLIVFYIFLQIYFEFVILLVSAACICKTSFYLFSLIRTRHTDLKIIEQLLLMISFILADAS